MLPSPRAGTIFIVGKNYSKVGSGNNPTFDYVVVAPTGSGVSETIVRNRLTADGISTTLKDIEDSNNKQIVWVCSRRKIDTGGVTYNLNYIPGTLFVFSSNSTVWKISNTGQAQFSNIFADGGVIAGWHITPDSIYLTDEEGKIRTSLNSGWDATYNVNRYTIITNSISAGGGSIGGWSIGPNALTGSNITLNSSGSITIGGATINGSSAGLNIDTNLSVTGGSISFGESA